VPADNLGSSDRIVVMVGGMSCAACVKAVTNALARVPGAAEVEVELETGRAVVAGKARPEALVAAVEKAGYDARLA
jgi:Cu+-exporting ATPase